MHTCYILKADSYSKCYIGYTVNFDRRLRQHNREIKGGAKKTERWYPYHPICNITGFEDNHQALRFEFRLQQMVKTKKRKDEQITDFYLRKIYQLISLKDKGNSWPILILKLFPNYVDSAIDCDNVVHIN